MFDDMEDVSDANLFSGFDDSEEYSIFSYTSMRETEFGHLGTSHMTNRLSIDLNRRTSAFESTPSLTSGSSFASLALPSPLETPLSHIKGLAERPLCDSTENIFEYIDFQDGNDDENLSGETSKYFESSLQDDPAGMDIYSEENAIEPPNMQSHFLPSNDLESILVSLLPGPESESGSQGNNSNERITHVSTSELAKADRNYQDCPAAIDDSISPVKRARLRSKDNGVGRFQAVKKEGEEISSSKRKSRAASAASAAAAIVKKNAKEADIESSSEASSEAPKRHFCSRLLRNRADGTITRCGKGFHRAHDLTRHEKTVHRPRLNEFVCFVCGVEFTRHDALVRHLQLKQSECGQQRKRKKRSRTYDMTEIIDG